AVIQWMMAKRPEDRPQNPAEAAMVLGSFCTGAGTPAPQPVSTPVALPPFFPEPDRPVLRSRLRATGTGILAPGFVLSSILALVGLGAVGAIAYVLLGDGSRTVDALGGDFTNSVGMTMVRLPPGSFAMGSPPTEPTREADEFPVHDALVPGPLFISAHEV